MSLQMRLYLLLALLFAIVYGIIVGVGSAIGLGNFIFYAVLALFLVGLQFLIGPSMVALMMRVRWVTEAEQPELHKMVGELASAAGMKKPKVGVSQLSLPNAFAFGRTRGDARVCVTEGLLRLLSKEELRAVLGHEISHIKHRDMALITLLSVIPLILWYLAWGLMWGGRSRNRGGAGYAALLGLAMMMLYFVTNLLVLYGSRIREYYADLGSVRLGSQPTHLATALYKLVYGNAKVPKESLRQVEGLKAFFVNDPSRAWVEIKELREIDMDMSGSIDTGELLALRSKSLRLGTADKIMEAMSTHPNMLKRIKHLSTLV